MSKKIKSRVAIANEKRKGNQEMRSNIVSGLGLGVLLVVTGAIAAESSLDIEDSDAVANSSRLMIPAKTIEKNPPRYPPFELEKGRDAWVRLAYCIDESGSTQNVSILDSVGSRPFDREAIRAVKKFKFEPALIDGKPSWQSRNEVTLFFSIEDSEPAASARFARLFRSMGDHIDQGRLENADAIFRDVYDHDDLSMYEFSKLWAQRARYERLRGDMYKMDIALHRATILDGGFIDVDSYISLLDLRVRVEISLGQYHAAIEAFEELLDLTGEDSELVIALKPVIDKLQNMINGDQILKIDAEVRVKYECSECNARWSFTPVRSDFSFSNIQGSLDSIEMSCDHKRFESKISAPLDWHIPDDWGECNVRVFGDPGTTFDVLMMPSS